MIYISNLDHGGVIYTYHSLEVVDLQLALAFMKWYSKDKINPTSKEEILAPSAPKIGHSLHTKDFGAHID